jgi:hypothetical protein
MAELVTVAGAVILTRAVHPVAEATAHSAAHLPATAYKADQVAEEAAQDQVEVKVVPGNNQVFIAQGLYYIRDRVTTLYPFLSTFLNTQNISIWER